MDEYGEWRGVVSRALKLVEAAAPVAEALRKAGASGHAYYQDTNNLLILPHDYPGLTDAAASSGACVIDPEDADPDDVYARIKFANVSVSDVFGPVAHVAGWKPNFVTNALGGPNALTSAVGTGLLGAGLGAGAGALGELVAGDRNIRRGALVKRLALLGGVAGAVPGLMVGTNTLGLTPGWSDWFKNYRPDDAAKTACLALAAVTDEDDDVYAKEADAAFEPSIRVDQFNRVVWADPNTPAPLRAATSGLLEGAQAYRGGASYVSPADVAGIAAGMGAGYISGLFVGKTLAALAGLTPQAQNDLQRAGTWAGLIKSTVPVVFGQPRVAGP